jgi:hypothetical protein
VNVLLILSPPSLFGQAGALDLFIPAAQQLHIVQIRKGTSPGTSKASLSTATGSAGFATTH